MQIDGKGMAHSGENLLFRLYVLYLFHLDDFLLFEDLEGEIGGRGHVWIAQFHEEHAAECARAQCADHIEAFQC